MDVAYKQRNEYWAEQCLDIIPFASLGEEEKRVKIIVLNGNWRRGGGNVDRKERV